MHVFAANRTIVRWEPGMLLSATTAELEELAAKCPGPYQPGTNCIACLARIRLADREFDEQGDDGHETGMTQVTLKPLEMFLHMLVADGYLSVGHLAGLVGIATTSGYGIVMGSPQAQLALGLADKLREADAR